MDIWVIHFFGDVNISNQRASFFTFPSIGALRAVILKSVYLLGNFFIGGYRQGPRLYVVSAYPELAHIYLIISQIVQTLNIAYNTKLQIFTVKLLLGTTAVFKSSHKDKPGVDDGHLVFVMWLSLFTQCEQY